MKKLAIIIIAVFSIVFSISAQEITVDKVEQDGTRFIFCSEINPNKLLDKIKVFPFLSASQTKEGEVIYELMVRIPSSTPISMSKGAILLLKTGNDEVITLYNNISCEDKIGTYITSLKCMNYNITPTYTIQEEDLMKFYDGIKKIRFETSLDVQDKEFKSDKIGSAIIKEYELIKASLSKQRNITDGF